MVYGPGPMHHGAPSHPSLGRHRGDGKSPCASSLHIIKNGQGAKVYLPPSERLEGTHHHPLDISKPSHASNGGTSSQEKAQPRLSTPRPTNQSNLLHLPAATPTEIPSQRTPTKRSPCLPSPPPTPQPGTSRPQPLKNLHRSTAATTSRRLDLEQELLVLGLLLPLDEALLHLHPLDDTVL